MEDERQTDIRAAERGPQVSAGGILTVFILLLAATLENWGSFAWGGLILLTATVGLCFWMHLGRDPLRALPAEPVLLGMVIACAAFCCCILAGHYQGTVQYKISSPTGAMLSKLRLTAPGMAIRVLFAVSLLIALAWLANLSLRLRRAAFIALVLIAIVVRGLMLASSPQPKIDVFVLQTEGARGLLGEAASAQAIPGVDGVPARLNPYRMSFDSPYAGPDSFDQYAYPPLVLYANAVSWVMFKDIRAVWLLCDLFGALCLFLLARRTTPGEGGNRIGMLMALIWLFLPRSLFVIEQSWTEPLCVATLGALALARGTWARGAALGLWLASKQYILVAAPLAARLRRFGWREWLLAVAVGGATFAPFIIWDWRGMYQDVLGFFLKSEARPDALSLIGMLKRFSIELPWLAVALLWLAGVAFFTWRMKRTTAGWLFSTASLYLFFFMLGKQAFMNYFYLILFILLLAVAATPVDKSQTSDGVSPAA